MTEQECKCKEVRELAKKVVVIALGTAIGVYGGLSLFAATHKPPRPNFHHMKRPPMEWRGDFQRGPHPDFHRMKFEHKGAPVIKEDIKKVGD